MPPRLLYVLCFLLSALMVASSHADDHLQKTPEPAAVADAAQNQADLDKGRKLFETHCALCHGPHGEGGKGPTLAQPNLPRASDDQSLLRIISLGIPNTEMPQAKMERAE